MTPGRIPRFAVLSLLVLALSGCGATPKTRFYTLGAVSMPTESASVATTYRVVVWPVTVPDLVDRPQLVMQVAANQVTLLDQDHWAEPLRSEVPRVVAANLMSQLSGAQVSGAALSGGIEPEFRVRVDITEFASVPGEGVRLVAQWSIQRGGAGGSRMGHSVIQLPANGSGNEALVAAHGQALARMSKDIAGAILALQASSK